MPVGLLAKLVAFVLFVLAAVGVFVGGRHVAALFEKLGGPSPPSAVRSSRVPTPSLPVVPAAKPPPAGRPKPRVAHPTPSTSQTIEPTVLAPRRPTRGALRPTVVAPATPRASAPPPRAEASPQVTAAAPILEAPPATGIEPVLVDLQIGRLVSRTVLAYRDGEEALVPLGAFFDLAEIRHTLSPVGELEARLEPSGRDIRVAATAESVAVGGRTLSVAARQLLFRDGELYLATERLGVMLDIQFDISWPDLTVTVLNPDSLPVARRMRRDQMRALLAARAGARPDTTLGPLRSRWDGVVLDYNVAFPISERAVGGSSYQFGLGAQVVGGAFDVSVRSRGTTDEGRSELGVSWRGVWADHTWLKQLTLGTGTLTGPRLAGIRGVSATNSPFVRPSLVGQLNYFGRLEPGWQLEAYTGSQLVAFDSIGPGGVYDLTLPVSYGENPVDFVAYGPYGQVRRFNQTYRVVAEQLPDQDIEYGLSAGACISDVCSSALNADLRYGLSRRVTVRGGVERYGRDSLPALLHPYASTTGLVGSAITLEGEVVGSGWVRGAARFEPSVDLRFGADYTVFDRGVDRPIIAPPGRRSQWVFDAFLRPIPRLGSFYLQGQAELDQGVELNSTRARVQASLQTHGIRLYPFVRVEGVAPVGGGRTTDRFVGVSTVTSGRPSWGPALSALWFRGDLESGGGKGLSFASASVARSFGPELRIEGGAGWRRGTSGVTFTLSLVSYLPTLQATTTAVAPAEGAGGTQQTLQGSVIYDGRQGRVRASPNPGLLRSGISGRVFVDQNANGRPDPDEPGVGGVRVIVGSNTARSDSLGRFQVWDIPAFEPVRVEVDTTTLDNPLYVPAFTSAQLSPPPNAYREFNLPLVTGAVLEGRVVMDGAPVPELTLVLTNGSSGRQTSLATFSDGTFYVMGVKPGRYTLEVDPRDLAARQLTGDPLRLTAAPDRPEQLGNLLLEVRPTAAPAPPR